MNNIIIRKATIDDAEKTIDINIKVWNTTYKDLIPQDVIDKLQVKTNERIENVKKHIRERQNYYVALVDGEVVGYNSFGPTKDENYKDSGEIYAAYVLDQYQSIGLGRKLAIACMKDLIDMGYTTLITKCLQKNPSNEFHKSIGGVLVGTCDCYLRDVYVGKENIYFHDDLTKSLEYNLNKFNNRN